MPTIAVDAMGGEGGARVAVRAAVRLLATRDDLRIVMVGQESALSPLLKSAPPSLSFADAPNVVAMDDLPVRAMRRRDTSMRRAMELVAGGEADAMVSAGNTGALLGIGYMVLEGIAGVERPAFASFIPNAKKSATCVLDLGANVDCSPQMLRQFAIMGTILVQAVDNVERPTVGLLNVGEESFKGREELKLAAKLLAAEKWINFIGNVEGYDIFRGKTDIVVCDGFTGNVALKVSEGLATMIRQMIRRAFNQNAMTKFCGVLASPVLRRLRAQMDHRRYNGACLLGLRGVVVKSHGNADSVAFAAAINYAIKSTRQNFLTRMEERLQGEQEDLL